MKKHGFTLVELLAVIVILGILLIIAVPKINNVIENAQKGAYKSTNSVIVSELRRQNGLEITPQVYTFTDGIMSPNIGITGELPKNGTVEINSLGQIQIVTSNDKYCAIKRFEEDNVLIFNVGERNCNVVVEITLTVNPNGGTYEGSTSNTTYSIPTEDFQTVNNPTRTGYTFDGWTIVGEGTYSNWMFQAGFTDATLTAKWILNPTLTVNLNSGTTSQTFSASYVPNTEIILITPTRSNNSFTGWTVSGTGSSITGTTLKIGTANTILTANWLAYTSMYTYTGSSTVIDDGSGNWRIRFLSSGTFTPLVNMTIDAFLVGGGGGGGGNGNTGLKSIGSGGGGGWTGTWRNIAINSNQGYSITVGGGGGASANGGNTYAFELAVPGGAAGYKLADDYGQPAGGAGGSGGGAGGRTWQWVQGGTGGSDGSSGQTLIAAGGTGQGTTTREFGEAGATIYAGGGGGGSYSNSIIAGQGGAGGGGRGYGGPTGGGPTGGETNTGSGGGGGSSGSGYYGAPGGSGIVIIRNKR